MSEAYTKAVYMRPNSTNRIPLAYIWEEQNKMKKIDNGRNS
jgi:hypothetical protein